MPKKPIAIDPEVINREGETQVVRDSGTNHSVLQRLSVGRGSLLPCSGYYPAERVGPRVADAGEEYASVESRSYSQSHLISPRCHSRLVMAAAEPRPSHSCAGSRRL